MTAEPITASVHIDAPPQQVYEYLTRPDAIVRWMGDYALLEPEPGGRFTLDVRGAPIRGRFLELQPPHRLLISWGYAGSERLPPGASTVEIRLTAHGGGTRVDLEHRDLPADEVLGHTIGWQHYIARLAVAATGREAGPDPGMNDPPSGAREPLRSWNTPASLVEEVHIALPSDRAVAGVAAAPEGPGVHPGVVVIHEVFGDQPEMRAVCEEFAHRGYVAAMPDLYSTGGPGFVCVARTMLEVASGKPGRAMEAIVATHHWLASRDDVDGERIGIIGFCMGGSFALAYIGREQSGISVAAVNYGEVPKRADALRSACPVVASYGRRDLGTRGHAARLRTHLEQLGIEHDVKLYDDAGHSFMTQGHHPIGRVIFLPMRIGYESKSAADAWERVYSFFDGRLKPG